MRYRFRKWILKKARMIMLSEKDRYCSAYHKEKCNGCPWRTEKYHCLPLQTWEQLLKF